MTTLDIKYRPETFEEVIGQDAVIASIKSLIQNQEDIPQAFLFHSQFSGVGKTTLARLIAQEIGCEDVDFHEINCASKSGKGDAESIIESAHFTSMLGGYQIFYMDEYHQANSYHQNTLLKVLEEPPGKTLFILTTTELTKIKKTIRTRCKQYEIKPVTYREIGKHLVKITKKEGISISMDILKKIASAANGSVREALSILSQVMNLEYKEDMEELIQSIKDDGDDHAVIEICRMLCSPTPISWERNIAPKLKSLQLEPEICRKT